MNINIKTKLSLVLVLVLSFTAITVVNSTAFAAKSYNDCADISNQNKKEKCEDDVYQSKLKDCIGSSTNENKIKACEKSTAKQPYLADKDSNNNPEQTTENSQELSNKPLINGAPSEEETFNYSCKTDDTDKCLADNPIVKWLNVLINIVAGVIGVGAVLMLIVAGIQYITSRDNAQGVADAKKKIINVVIGLAAFVFLYAFLNWLIPGGVFA